MIDSLIKIVGKENVSIDEIDLAVYSFDASELEGKARVVVWPKSTEEVSKILRLAYADNLAIVPRGAGTNLTGGAVPFDSIVLDTSRMNSIIEINEDYVVTETGVVLEDLERAVKEKGKFFPVQPASDKACSIGGCITEDCAGINAIKYGTMKEWVNELEVVLPNGKVIKTSSKEFCGSEGILGVITKANLKIIDEPLVRTLSIFEFEDYTELQRRVIELSKANVLALEFVSKIANDIIDKPMGKENIIIVEFEDERGDLRGDDFKRVHEHRKTVPTQLAVAGYLCAEDPKVPLNKISKFLKALEELKLPSYGHIGVGILHARFAKEKDRRKILDLAISLGGSAVGEHGIGILKRGLAKKDWLIPLKKKYDAKGILNPGKVLGKRKELEIPEIKICPICGICRWRCPIFKILLRESVSPRGKAILIEKEIENELYYKCTLCRACEEVCPASAELTKDIRRAREKLVEGGRETVANKKMIKNIREYGNPFGKVEKDKIPKELYCC